MLVHRVLIDRILQYLSLFPIFLVNPLEKCPLLPNQQNEKMMVSSSSPNKNSFPKLVTCTFSIALAKKYLVEHFSSPFSSVYELPFYDTKIPRGFYTIHLTLTPRNNEGKFIGLTDNTVRRKSIDLPEKTSEVHRSRLK